MKISSLINFKEGFEKVLREEWNSLKPTAQGIANDMALYCYNHGKKFILTDILSDALEDKKLGRLSASHSEGRAFDFRTLGWSKDFIDKFEKHFETKYVKVAAVGATSGNRNLLEFHNNGNGDHGHCQIQRGIN